MSQKIECPNCGKHLQIQDDLVGTSVQCPECQHAFKSSPLSEDETPAAAPAPPPSDEPDYKRDKDGDGIRKPKVPGKVTNLGVIALVGGIMGVLFFLILGGGSAGFCCLWPGTYYSLVMGIMAIMRGSALLGADAARQNLPTGIAIMMIINIINGDVVNLVLGIVMLNICSDKEVKEYLAK